MGRPRRVLSADAGEVPDVLARELRVLFCGINPGRLSAAARAHFANPRNDLWRLLHAAGFTGRLLDPAEQHLLPEFGLGVTNAAHRTTPGSGDLRRADFEGAERRLAGIAAELGPGWIAFVGKEAYRGVFRERPELGLQERRLGRTRLFVLPSTSPANAAVPWEERLALFAELAELSRPVVRPAVRAILLDLEGRIFLHRFRAPGADGVWIAPGGAVEAGEAEEEALRRELREELGLERAEVGPWVWSRRHIWFWAALETVIDTRERFAVVRGVQRGDERPTAHDALVWGPDTVEEHHWWSVEEIERSGALFAPRLLGQHLRRLLEEPELPAEVVDVGI